jgi:hypothetical protein
MKTLEINNPRWALPHGAPFFKPAEKPNRSTVRYQTPKQPKVPLSIIIGLVVLIVEVAVLFG